ncbi:MAG: TIGR03546 family protein [Ignavibacteriales bacterium]|nr:TIGR03546 family protein [Ignavibacteriales bacterium]
MFIIKLLSDFLKILRAGQAPGQVAGGFALGSIVGLSPTLTLQGLAIWLIILILDVNLSAAILAFTFFSLVAYVFDPIFHSLGYLLLVDVEALKGLWTTLYNAPIAPLTRFNNTVVLGSLSVALLFFFPLYWGIKKLYIAYRDHLHTKIEQWKIYKIVSKSVIVQWYLKIRDWGIVA